MELISIAVLGILGIVGAACSRQLADEFKAWTPWLTDKLIRRAARKLEPDIRDRLREEWHSHLQEIPGDIGKLLMALSLQRAGYGLSTSVPYFHRLYAAFIILLLLPLILLIACVSLDPKRKGVFERVEPDERFENSKSGYVTVFICSGPIGVTLKKTGLDRLPHLIDIAVGKASIKNWGSGIRGIPLISLLIWMFYDKS